MRDLLTTLVIESLANALSAFIIAAVCAPIVLPLVWSVRREYSFDFWARTVLISQLLFWAGFFLSAANAQYGLIQNDSDLVGWLFRFLISVPATALIVRTCMRFRDSIRSKSNVDKDPPDRLDAAFKAGNKLGKLANFVTKHFTR